MLKYPFFDKNLMMRRAADDQSVVRKEEKTAKNCLFSKIEDVLRSTRY